eukprot:TRINITY_DN1710_c0_g1_i7.p4 TRINITY_DN1710_c0_g1~~TRINITY_DN1710_c0_g1_i7.p4  ORF type:complete len:219 (-),score=76.37 TRINITY_DN1710_c0_g1_i7:1596-2252(-)
MSSSSDVTQYNAAGTASGSNAESYAEAFGELGKLGELEGIEGVSVGQLMNEVVDDLVGRQQDFRALYLDAFGENVDGLQGLVTVVEAAKVFVKQCIRLGLTGEQVMEDLTTCGNDEAMAKGVTEIIFGRDEELKEAFVAQTAQISGAHLEDFDWKVHLRLGSSKLSEMRKPVLLLNLNVKGVGGKEGSRKQFEVDRKGLEELIGVLEEANEKVVEMKA